MSRLFYDPPEIPSIQGGKKKSAKLSGRQYFDKVASLIPGEVIAGYLAIENNIRDIKSECARPYFYWGAFGLGVVCTVLYLNWQAYKGKPKIIHIAIAVLAFVCWAYNTTGEYLVPALYAPAIGSIILVAFTMLTGKIPLKF